MKKLDDRDMHVLEGDEVKQVSGGALPILVPNPGWIGIPGLGGGIINGYPIDDFIKLDPQVPVLDALDVAGLSPVLR